MATAKKGPIDSTELYRMGTLLFAGTSVVTFIVLYLFILADKPRYYASELADLLLGGVLLVFTLLFAIAYVLSVKRTRLNAAKKMDTEKSE